MPGEGSIERERSNRSSCETEIIESMMRPGAVRTVAEGHEQTQEDIEGYRADGE